MSDKDYTDANLVAIAESGDDIVCGGSAESLGHTLIENIGTYPIFPVMMSLVYAGK